MSIRRRKNTLWLIACYEEQRRHRRAADNLARFVRP